MARWINDYHLAIFLLRKFNLQIFGKWLLQGFENICGKGWNSKKKHL